MSRATRSGARLGAPAAASGRTADEGVRSRSLLSIEGAGFSSQDVLREAVDAELAFHGAGGMRGDPYEAAARLAALRNTDILASPSLRRQIMRLRQIIEAEPAHAHTIIGKKLRAILSALMPPPPGRGKTRPPTRSEILDGRRVLAAHKELVRLINNTVAWADSKGLRVVEAAHFSKKPLPPPAVYGNGNVNRVGDEVEPFAVSLANATNGVLAGRGLRTGLRPEVAAAVWLYEVELASATSRTAAMAWLRRVRARVSWQGRRYAAK